MQNANMELLIEQARAHAEGELIARCVLQAICQGIPAELPDEAKVLLRAAGASDKTVVVVPGRLRQALADAGLRVCEDAAAHEAAGMKPLKHLTRLLIWDDANILETMPAEEFERCGKPPLLVARGESDSANNALLHAVLGYLRECDIEKLGYIVPIEFHRADPAKINVVTLNGRKFSGEEVANLKSYLGWKREAK